MKFHEASDIFPLMQGDDFKLLKNDIAKNGQHEPIIIFQNQIIDGRNRFRVCQELGIESPSIEWEENGSLIDFVISKNLHRRHLNESQRGMVAARIANLKKGQRQDRQICPSTTQKEASDLLGISERSVKSARKVQSEGIPELTDKVDKGEIAVSTASVIAETPKAEQKQIIQLSEKEILHQAKKIKERKSQARKQKRLEQIKLEGASKKQDSNDCRFDHGDCLEIIPSYPDHSIDVLLTDPPYGQAYVSNRREIENDITIPIESDTPDKAFKLLDNILTAIKPKLKKDAFVYIFTSWKTLCQTMEVTSRHFGKVNTVLTWDKVNKTSGDLSIWGDACEFIVFHKLGLRETNHRLENVIRNIPRLPFSDLHPTEKPVELMEYILKNSGDSNDTFCDPFMGAGAVPLAAQKQGWTYYAIELVEKYYNISKLRMGL